MAIFKTTGRAGKSLVNRLNSKQTNPTRTGGAGISSLDAGGTVARYSGRRRATVPDAPGGATRTNAKGKRAGGSDTTALT